MEVVDAIGLRASLCTREAGRVEHDALGTNLSLLFRLTTLLLTYRAYDYVRFASVIIDGKRITGSYAYLQQGWDGTTTQRIDARGERQNQFLFFMQKMDTLKNRACGTRYVRRWLVSTQPS